MNVKYLAAAVICSAAVSAHAACTGVPEGLSFDSSGDLWVAYYDRNIVQAFDSVQGLNGFTSDPLYIEAGINGPTRVTAVNGNLYVSNSTGNSVTIYENAQVNGGLYQKTPSITVSGVHRPLGIAVDKGGNFFVAENQTSDVQAYTPPNSLLGSKTGDANGDFFIAPGALAISGSTLYVGTFDGVVRSYNETDFLKSYRPPTCVPRLGCLPTFALEGIVFADGVSGGVTGISVDPQNNVWVAYYNSSDVVEYSATGKKLATITTAIDLPEGIAVQPSTGNVYVANAGSCQITVYSPEGNYLGDFQPISFN